MTLGHTRLPKVKNSEIRQYKIRLSPNHVCMTPCLYDKDRNYSIFVNYLLLNRQKDF